MIQDSSTELAFKYAVYKINKDPTILANKTLTYDIQYVPREDSFRTTNKVGLELSINTVISRFSLDLSPSELWHPGAVWTQ